MNVHVFNQQSSLEISEETIPRIVAAFCELENTSFDEVAIYFVESEEICQLHQKFFNDPSPTDCISFPMDDRNEEGYRILGDIFVCPRTAVEYVAEHGGNPHRETTLYVIHGLLHLLGYDDIDEEKTQEMRKAEKRHISHLESLDLCLKKPSTS